MRYINSRFTLHYITFRWLTSDDLTFFHANCISNRNSSEVIFLKAADLADQNRPLSHAPETGAINSTPVFCAAAQLPTSKAVNDVRSCASTRKLVPKCGVEVSPMALISGACHQPNSAACWQWTGLITSHVTCQHRGSVFNRRRLPRTSESSCLLFLPVIIHLCLLCNNYCIQHTTELVTGPKFTNKIDLVKKYSAKQVDTCSKMWNTDIQ